MKTVKYLIAFVFLGSVIAIQGVSQTAATVVNPNSPAVKLRLNGKDAGTAEDPKTLVSLLKEVFTYREENGILAPNTNEIESTVLLGGEGSVPADTIAGLYGVLTDAGSKSVLFPVRNPARPARPNPLLLYVHAGAGELPMVNSGIAVGFIGELFENRFAAFSPVAVTANADGTYSIGGKQLAAAALATELAARVKVLKKGEKIVFLQANNYGNIDDVASMAAAAGATKLYVVTKNAAHKEGGISFSLSPAFTKDTEREPIEGFTSQRFRRPDYWSFEVTVVDELLDPERADAEIQSEFERRKADDTDASVFMDEIGGAKGFMTIRKDEGYSAQWWGTRKQGAKRQLVKINFTCSSTFSEGCKERSAFTESEFLQIKSSIRFE